MADHSQAFHDMMDHLMDGSQRMDFNDVIEEASKYGYGPYSEDRLRKKIRNSSSDESGHGFTIDRFHGTWWVERYV